MTIVLLNQYYAPDEAATARLLADVGAALVAAGHDVSAICSQRSYSDPTHRYPSRDSLQGVRVQRAWTSGFGRGTRTGRLVDYVLFLAGAARLLVVHRKPDFVLSLSTPPLVAGLGLLIARLRGAKSLFWVMDVYPDIAFELGVLRSQSLVGRFLGLLSTTILRHSDKVVALDERMAERLRAQAGGKVLVIPNWADGASMPPRSVAGHPLRREWGWEGRFVVMYSGNMGLAHEFETAIGAATNLAHDPSILFAFVGDGPRRAEAQELAGRLRLENVEFRPYVPRALLGESLTAGDVHLVTLRDRMPGLLVPSKIYGILAAGRPTLYVGPEAGEIAEIVTKHACGASVRTGDVEGLVRAVVAYQGDESRRDAEGKRARSLFEERFTKERGTRTFIQLIQSLSG